MDLRKVSTQNNYAKVAQLYAQDFGEDQEHFDRFIKNTVELITNRNLTGEIIDLGSGPGNVIDYLLEFSLKNQLVALDFVPEMIEMLMTKYKKYPSIRVIEKDMNTYIQELDDQSVAAHIANYSVIHLLDDEVDAFFGNIHRTLQYQGLFTFSVFKGSNKGMEPEPYQQENDHRLQVTEKLESYLNNFTENELQESLVKVGLQILEMKTFEPEHRPGEYPQAKIWTIAEKV